MGKGTGRRTDIVMPQARPKRRRGAPQIRILLGSATTIGPGKVGLIEAIARTGSISAAARELGMSYRRAWVLVDSVNQHSREPVVATATGGRGGGGARVTPFGEEVLSRYRAMEAKATASVRAELEEFSRFLGATR